MAQATFNIGLALIALLPIGTLQLLAAIESRLSRSPGRTARGAFFSGYEAADCRNCCGDCPNCWRKRRAK
jgi:hypothetical protein